MFNGVELIKEETLRLDHDETALTFTKDNTEEVVTMTKEEFVTHLIQHSENYPDVGEIAADDAQTILDYVARSAAVPDITASEFTVLWNRLIHDPAVMDID